MITVWKLTRHFAVFAAPRRSVKPLNRKRKSDRIASQAGASSSVRQADLKRDVPATAIEPVKTAVQLPPPATDDQLILPPPNEPTPMDATLAPSHETSGSDGDVEMIDASNPVTNASDQLAAASEGQTGHDASGNAQPQIDVQSSLAAPAGHVSPMRSSSKRPASAGDEDHATQQAPLRKRAKILPPVPEASRPSQNAMTRRTRAASRATANVKSRKSLRSSRPKPKQKTTAASTSKRILAASESGVAAARARSAARTRANRALEPWQDGHALTEVNRPGSSRAGVLPATAGDVRSNAAAKASVNTNWPPHAHMTRARTRAASGNAPSLASSSTSTNTGSLHRSGASHPTAPFDTEGQGVAQEGNHAARNAVGRGHMFRSGSNQLVSLFSLLFHAVIRARSCALLCPSSHRLRFSYV